MQSLRGARLRLLGPAAVVSSVLSDTSDSGPSLKLASGVSRVPVEGSSSNLLWDGLKCLVFPLSLAWALSFLICMLAKFSS